jgi:hypothetical protein
VFDKGVDAVQDTIYFYLVELSKSIEKIMCENRDNQELLKIFNEKFEFLIQRLSDEIKFMIECLTRKSINDIKYTKIVAHLILMNKLKPFVSEKNRKFHDETLEILDKNKLNLNCFINSFN